MFDRIHRNSVKLATPMRRFGLTINYVRIYVPKKYCSEKRMFTKIIRKMSFHIKSLMICLSQATSKSIVCDLLFQSMHDAHMNTLIIKILLALLL